MGSSTEASKGLFWSLKAFGNRKYFIRALRIFTLSIFLKEKNKFVGKKKIREKGVRFLVSVPLFPAVWLFEYRAQLSCEHSGSSYTLLTGF